MASRAPLFPSSRSSRTLRGSRVSSPLGDNPVSHPVSNGIRISRSSNRLGDTDDILARLERLGSSLGEDDEYSLVEGTSLAGGDAVPSGGESFF